MTTIVTKTAVDPTTNRLASRFYASAREGLADALAALEVTPSDTVLLPAFIGYSAREGSGVHDPVATSGAGVEYYALDDELSPDLTSLEPLMAGPDVRVLVVIHYYGRTARHLQRLRALADHHGVVVVEDLAHGLFTAFHSGQAGRVGDIQLFSLHKMLPIPYGGMLRFRNHDVAEQCVSTRPELAQFVFDYDWAAISAKRRKAFDSITAQLMKSDALGHDFALLWPTLASHDVPQTLPVRVLNGSRDVVYAEMNRRGFGMVSLYHTLIDEVQDVHPSMTRLAREITNFPVHQDLDPSIVPPMVDLFLDLLRSTTGGTR